MSNFSKSEIDTATSLAEKAWEGPGDYFEMRTDLNGVWWDISLGCEQYGNALNKIEELIHNILEMASQDAEGLGWPTRIYKS